MTIKARTGYLLKLFVAVLGPPWLIFLSTSIPLYLSNQAEFQHQFDILYLFAFVVIAVDSIAALFVLLITRLRSNRFLRYFFWLYFFSGVLFLAASSLHRIELLMAYKITLGLGLLCLTFAVTVLIDRKLSLKGSVDFFAIASVLFIFIDLVQLFNRLETNVPLNSKRNDFNLAVDSSVSGLKRLPNIYHILLDEYQTEMFSQTLDEEVQGSLAGFHFFPDTTTLFGRTGMSLPSIFTGQDYDFSTAQIDYQRKAFNSEESFLYWLRRAGYQTSAYLHPVYDFEQNLFEYVMFHEELEEWGRAQYQRVFNNLWLYSVLPVSLAKFVVDNEYIAQQHNQNVLNPAAPIMSLNTMRQVLDDEERLKDHGRYMFVHLILPHFPYVLKDDCSYSEKFVRTSALSQSGCATKLIVELVQTLKKLGRFTDSFIIVQSDHGARFAERKNRLVSIERLGPYSLEWSKARSRSLLLIKPNGESAQHTDFTVSGIPASLLDIAPTLMHAIAIDPSMRMSGIDLLNPKDNFAKRVRYYHFYDKKGNNDWTDNLTRYSIHGGQLRKDREIRLTNNSSQK